MHQLRHQEAERQLKHTTTVTLTAMSMTTGTVIAIVDPRAERLPGI